MLCSKTRHRPDGPWSWFSCFCASVCTAVHLGLSISFGVFLPELMKEFDENRQNTVWLGSLAISLTFFLGPLGSILCKTIGCRFTAIAGGLICAVGLFLTSYSCSLMLMFFTYSFLFGLGASLIFSACFLVTAKNFRKFQNVAVGIGLLGGSVGMLFYGPFIQFLIDMVGWRGAYRVISALFGLVCICGASFSEPSSDDESKEDCQEKSGNLKWSSVEQDVAKSTESKDLNKNAEHSNLAFEDDERVGVNVINSTLCSSVSNAEKVWSKKSYIDDVKMENKEETSKLIDFSVFKVPRFTIVTISVTIMGLGHFTPPLHLITYCLELGISADSASQLFIFIGLASSVSRVVSGRLCDISWVNMMYVYQFGNLLVGFVTIALPLIQDYTGILVFAIIYGVGDGIFITTGNSLLMFTVDEKRRAAALGLGCGLYSLGVAGGAPLAGFLADKYDCYTWSFIVAGILMQCAGVLPVALVWLKKEERSHTPGRQIVEFEGEDAPQTIPCRQRRDVNSNSNSKA